MKGMVARSLEVVRELLDARLVRNRRVRKRTRARRLCVILLCGAMNQIDPLGLGVVGLEVLVGERPCRGDPAVVVNLTEVVLAKPEKDRTVDLGVASHVV